MDFPTKHMMLRCFAVLWLGKARIGSTSLFSRPNVETSTEPNSTWDWCADPASQERWYCGFFYEGQRLLRGEYVYDRDPGDSAMRWMLKRCGSAFVSGARRYRCVDSWTILGEGQSSGDRDGHPAVVYNRDVRVGLFPATISLDG